MTFKRTAAGIGLVPRTRSGSQATGTSQARHDPNPSEDQVKIGMPQRIILGFVCSLAVAAPAFSVGWRGPAGAVFLSPFVFAVMILTAGPGALVESIILAVAMNKLAGRGTRRAIFVPASILVGILLGLVNIFPAERLLYSVTGDYSVVKLADIPLAYLLSGLFGGAACGFGVCIGLERRKQP